MFKKWSLLIDCLNNQFNYSLFPNYGQSDLCLSLFVLPTGDYFNGLIVKERWKTDD